MNARRVRKLHRWIGLLFSVSALLSSGSGVLHQVMSRTQSPPPPARPAGAVAVDRVRLSPKDLLTTLTPAEAAAVHGISLRSIKGEPWYQIIIGKAEQPAYVNAVTGQRDDTMDDAYAADIAASASAGKDVSKRSYLREFDAEYINIFRILPVYRYDVADGRGTRLYISSLTGSVTRSTDDKKQFEAMIFSYGHKLMFIKNRDVRDLVLVTMTGGIFVVSLLGIGLFFLTRRSPRPQ